MGIAKTKLGVRLLMIYSSLVTISLIIGFAGDQSPLFLLVAVFLTLPWSLSLMPSYGFSLVHGALDYDVALYFVAFAAVNALIIYFIGKMIERVRK
jgi:hypothetical protein